MTNAFEIVNRAFSKQSVNYDADDSQNSILKEWRQQVYQHVHQFLKPGQPILELNAGTGIDAFHFAISGNPILATDLSNGMVHEIERKIQAYQLSSIFTCRQLSYDQLNVITDQKFDYVFSNFGGLNCIDDLSKVTRHLPSIMNKGGYVTWVIMPKVCVWEMLGIFKGNGRKALRRLKKSGVIAHLEGEYFPTYYHSLSDIKKAFSSSFRFIKSEGLGSISPPPHRDDLAKQHQRLYKGLRKIDAVVRNSFPFNRWGDHIIITFQFNPQ